MGWEELWFDARIRALRRRLHVRGKECGRYGRKGVSWEGDTLSVVLEMLVQCRGIFGGMVQTESETATRGDGV